MPPNNNDDSQEFTLADIIRTGIDSAFADVYTAMPGVVQSVINSKFLVDVQLQIRQSYVDESGNKKMRTRPVIPNVPLIYPGSGNYRVTFPVDIGDTVLVVFSSEALDSWKRSGTGICDPESSRKHHITDAIAIPGLVSPAFRPGLDTLVAGDAITLHSGKIKLGGSGAIHGVVRDVDLQSTLSSLLSDPAVVSAINSGIGVLAAITAHFAANPPSSSNVLTAL